MKTTRFTHGLAVSILLGAWLAPAWAHNLDQRDTSIVFDDAYVQLMSTRAGQGQPMVQVGDEPWLILKSTPGPGTLTGVGGYLTFYIPTNQIQVIGAAYLTQTPGTPTNNQSPANFTAIPMKGQSIIAIGSGPIGAASTTNLIGLTLSNSFGQVENAVGVGGIHRGTIAGVYADTGIFYSDDPRTAWQSWANAPATGPLSRRGYSISMVNNRGETIVPITRYEAEQEIAYGRSDEPAILDPNQRGNTPWGLGNVVAGPQSGYAWEFNLNRYIDSGSNMIASVTNVGPWKRIQYPGSQYSKDQAGLVSSALGFAGENASTLGYTLAATNPLAATANAVRFSYGMLELGRPEYAAVRIRVVVPPPDSCLTMNTDAFGGDAGGEQGGKDHEWRYYDPTTATLSPCTFLTKVASDSLVPVGSNLSFKITFANVGNVALTNIVLTDQLQAGFQFLSSVPAQNSGPNPLIWNLGTVATGSLRQITVNVKAIKLGTWSNQVVATSGTNVIARAEETVEVSAKALLRAVKTAPTGCNQPGSTVTYTLDVLNEGTGPNGTPLTVFDLLPPGFSYGTLQSATLNGAALPLSAVTVVATNLNRPRFAIGQSIQADKKLTLVFTATISPAQAVGSYYNEVQLGFEGKVVSGAPTAPVEVCGGKIGDFVWRDWDGDGVQDVGEEGLSNVTVVLTYYGPDDVLGGGDDVLTTNVTDATGYYLFSGLGSGKFSVDVPAPGAGGVPTGYTLTTANDPLEVPLTNNEVYLTADFGYQPAGTGAIGDSVYNDVNGNRVQDVGEVGITNVTVWLYEDTNGNGVNDSGDLRVATTNTTTGGIYSFPGLATNISYLVDVDEASTGLTNYFSPNTFVATTPALQAVPNLSGTYNNADFGYIANLPSSIGDQVFIDKNGDGIYTNTVDLPLPGITVWLYRDSNGDGVANDGPAVATNVTDASGQYLFGNLPPDTYLVKVDTTDTDLPGGLGAVVSQYIVKLDVNTNHLTADFPFAQLINKTVDKSTANPTDTLTFTITPQYPGSGGLTNVTVTDLVPTGTTFASAGQGGANSPPGTVTWSLGSTTAATNGSKTISGGSAATIAQRGSTTSATGTSSITINKPTGVVAGDVMIANINIKGGNTFPSLAGWTTIATASIEPGTGGKYHRNALLYRVADGTEGASFAFTFAATVPENTTGAIVAFSGVDTTGGFLVGGGSGGPFDVAPGAWTVGAASTSISGVSAITTASANALVLMFVGAFDNATSVSAFSTTSPGALNMGSYSFSNADGTIGSGWQAKAVTGTTGTGSATLGASKKWGAILLALRPATTVTYSYATTTALSANQSLVTSNNAITVTLTVTATGSGLPVTVTAGALTVTGTSGCSATFGAASPLTQSVSNGVPATFTYASTSVTAGSTPGVLTFKATPSDSNGTWAQGTANTVLVTPPLTFTATVNNPPGVNVVTNQAKLNTNGFLVAASPITYTALSASIGDFVWADLDGDGVQDAGETGISNVTVQLYLDLNDNGVVDGGEGLVQSAVTDDQGLYRFYGVLPGTNYVVTYDYATVPAGYLPTTDGDADAGKTQHDVDTITGGQQYVAADFGLQPAGAASIGDTVWLDANNNGTNDVGEIGLTNVTVNLYYDANANGVIDAGDFFLQSTTTDTNGLYVFTGLNTNSYLVQVDESSLVPSPYDGSSAISNSMALVSGTNPKAVTIATPNQAFVDADFGYNWKGTIGDYVWWDDNRDGLQDMVELPISNAVVMLFFDANGNGIYDVFAGDVQIAYDITDTNGLYAFTNLPPGPYHVDVYEDSIERDGPVPTAPSTANSQYIELDPGETNLTADFGYIIGARVEGNVFWDENRNAIFDAPPELGLTNVAVYLTWTNMSGTTFTLTNFTDSAGHFYFVVPEGEYTLTYSTPTLTNNYPLLTDQTTATNFTFYASPGESWVHPPFDFGVDNNGRIGDTIFADVNGNGTNEVGEAGLGGVTVELYIDINNDNQVDAGDAFLEAQSTDANGKYLFLGLPDSNYVVRVSTGTLPGGYQTIPSAYPTNENAFASASMAGATITNGIPILDRDFGYPPVPGPVYTLSGTVYVDANTNGAFGGGEAGISNVTVTVGVDTNSDGTNDVVYTIPTATDGTYSIAGIPSNSTVTVTVNEGTLPNPAYVLSGDPNGGSLSNVYVVANINADTTNVDFGYFANYGSINGTIVTDADGDGFAETNETPLGGWTVTLTYAGTDGILGTGDDVATTQVTDNFGNYSFTNLLPGQYAVTKTNPAGYFDLADADGGNASNISVTLAQGQTVVDRDFEVARSGSLGDRVWLDEDGDGLQDAGEAGIANAKVLLYDATGTAVLATNYTDGEGNYLFTGLAPATYVVKVDSASLPAGLAANPTYDEDGTNTAHQSTATVGAGSTHLTSDFGYNWAPPGDTDGGTGTGAIGDRIWIDADGDGAQDPGEAGLGGVSVTLFVDADTNGTYETSYATTTTAADGSYVFDNLPAGAYSVKVTPPSGYAQTGDPDHFGATGANDNQTTTPIIVAPGDVFVNADFGYQPNAGTFGDVSGTLWFDANANSNGPAGTPGGTDVEPVYAGVTVALIQDLNGNGIWDAGEPIIASTTTDAAGNYVFPGLPVTDGAGTDDYLVWVNDVANVLDGTTPTYDSNGTGTPNVSAATNLTNAGDSAQDFGYTATGQTAGQGLIGDTIFLDRDEDGLADAGEGLAGVIVRLYDATGTNLLAATTTDPNGLYSFGGLNTNGTTYVVKVDTTTLPFAGLSNTVDPNGGNDSQSTVTLTGAAPVDLAQDFGYRDTTSPNTIGGTLWNDRNADGTLDGGETNYLGGVTVVLRDTNGNAIATAITDANGNYSFTNLPDGTYRIDVTDAGNVLNGWWHSDGPNDGTDGNSQTDPYTVTVSGGAVNTTGDFGYYVEPAALGNYVWDDLNGDGIQNDGAAGISNVVVTLAISYPNGTTSLVSTVTDASGYYSFGNLLVDEDLDGAGGGEPTYSISVATPAGYLVSPLNATSEGLDSDNPAGEPATATKGTLNDTYDFGFAMPVTIGDFTWVDLNGNGQQDTGAETNGLAGVVVTLYRPDNSVAGVTTSSVSGAYAFTNLPPGSYYVGFVASGYQYTTNDVGSDATDSDLNPATGNTATFVLTSGQTNLTLDAGFYQPSAIGNYTWVDTNGDGVQTGGEPALSNVEVTLYNAASNVIGTTTSDVSGAYAFTNLPPGDYFLSFVPPAGYQNTSTDAGGNDALDSDVLAGTNRTAVVTLTSGQTQNDVDAGFYLPASIGNYTWVDTNGNGQQDGGEPALADVEITLYDATNGMVGVTTSDVAGAYAFTNLPPGNYKLDFKIPSGYALTTNNVGADATDSDPSPINGETGTIVLDNGETDNTVDAGFYQPVTIGDRVWYDQSRDGIQDAGETNGLGGILVALLDANSNLFATATTELSGAYVFTNIPPGTYFVQFDLTNTTGWLSVTLANQGSPNNDEVDSDVTNGGVGGLAWTDTFAVKSGQSNLTIDLGLRPFQTTRAQLSEVWGEWTQGQGRLVWRTGSEWNTAGFYAYRVDPETGAETRLSDILTQSAFRESGAIYELADAAAREGDQATYRLEEVELSGEVMDLGPYAVTFGPPPAVAKAARAEQAAKLARKSAPVPQAAPKAPGPSSTLKVLVRSEGIYGVSLQAIADGMGLALADVQTLAAEGQLEINAQGQPVPVLFDAAQGRVVFHGQGTDNWYTRDAAYLISAGAGLAMPRREPGAAAGDSVFPSRVRFEQDRYPLLNNAPTLPEDFYYWNFVIGTTNPAANRVDFGFNLDGYSGGALTLAVDLVGWSKTARNPDHRVEFSLNGTPVGTFAFDDQNAATAVLAIPAGVAASGANVLTVRGALLAATDYSYFVVDGFTAEYDRSLVPGTGAAYFEAGAAAAVSAGAFAQPLALALDAAGNPIWIADENGALPAKAWAVASAGERFAVIETAGVPLLEPEAAKADAWFLSATNRIDYLVIASRELVSAAQELADYRAGQGLRVGVATFEDVCDLLAGGLRTPEAIPELLGYAAATWAESPWMVVLAGNGHLDYLGALSNEVNQLPPMLTQTRDGLFAADGLLADADGDAVQDLALGRLPARTSAELATLIAKIKAYEADFGTAWQNQIVLASDKADGAAGNFQAANDALAALADARYPVARIDLDATAIAPARLSLTNWFKAGAGFIHFTGHGGVDSFSKLNLLKATDLNSLTNARKPVVVALSCLVGRFETPAADSLGEALLRRAQGGAVSVWGPSGLSQNAPATQLGEAFYRAILQQGAGTLGLAILQAHRSLPRDLFTKETFAVYNLLGDPALRIAGNVGGQAADANFAEWRWQRFAPAALADPATSGATSANFFDYAMGYGYDVVAELPEFGYPLVVLAPGEEPGFILRWKRRVQRSDLDYQLFLSENLQDWETRSGDLQTVGVLADPDGIMETVRTKVNRPDAMRVFIGVKAIRK
jgi:uncharacterized repeat protein (TIGR01451 family)